MEVVQVPGAGGGVSCCEPIQVGCREFADPSLCKVYTLLRITGAAKWKAIKSVVYLRVSLYIRTELDECPKE